MPMLGGGQLVLQSFSGNLGRLGRHRVHDSHFGVAALIQRSRPDRGCSGCSCPGISGTTTTSSSATIVSNEDQLFTASKGARPRRARPLGSPPSHLSLCSMHVLSCARTDCRLRLSRSCRPSPAAALGHGNGGGGTVAAAAAAVAAAAVAAAMIEVGGLSAPR